MAPANIQPLMSELDRTRRITRRMGLSRESARNIAEQAFEADLRGERPEASLRCAEEFRLGEQWVTRAAVALFEQRLTRHEFREALQLVEGYNLHHAAYAREHFDPTTLLGGNEVRARGPGAAALQRILALMVEGRAHVEGGTDEALELLREAIRQQRANPHREGRCIHVPQEADVILVGDLHGSTENLGRAASIANLATNPKRVLVLQEIVHSRLLARDRRDLSFVTILESLRLMRAFPHRVHVLLGNHDLGLFCGRDLIKGGKSLNSFLFRGMEHLFRDRYKEVLALYRHYINVMPVAVRTPAGVLMTHSTPLAKEMGRFSPDFLTTGPGASEPIRRCREIHALVNGRDYTDETADRFATLSGADVFICGHTPSWDGWKSASKRHLIIDSQHERGCYVRFDASGTASLKEVRKGLARLNGKPLDRVRRRPPPPPPSASKTTDSAIEEAPVAPGELLGEVEER